MKSYKKGDIYLKMILYGAAGVGKTTFVATAQKYPEIFGDILWINSSGNPEIIKSFDNIQIFDLEKLIDLNIPADWLLSGKPDKHVIIEKFGVSPNTKTIVIDCFSDLQKEIFNTTMGITSIGQIPTKPQFDHWGALYSWLQNAGKVLFQTIENVHVITTLWETNDTSDGITHLNLNGKGREAYPGYANLVVRMVKNKQMPSNLKLKGSRSLLLDVNQSFTKVQIDEIKSYPNILDNDPDIMDLISYFNITGVLEYLNAGPKTKTNQQ